VVIVAPQADLSLSIVSSGSPVTVGSNLTYTITVSNLGPCAATGVSVSNFLSAGQITLAVTNALNAPAQACPFPGPNAWWKGEGDARDAAAGNNGTVGTGVTFAAGEVGQTFNFDGTSGSISVPDSAGLRPQSLTIEGWIRPDDVSGFHVVIGKHLGLSANNSYSVWISSGTLFAGLADNSGPGPSLSCPSPVSQWFHVAYSFDSVAQAQALYVNGALVNAGFVNKTIAYDTHSLLIGAGDNGGSPGFFYKGKIDELTLYPRPLTGTEVEAIYNTGGAGKCQSPGLFMMGDIASGVSTQVVLVALPTSCPLVSSAATVTSSTGDPDLSNNTAVTSVPVQDSLPDEFLLTVQNLNQDNTLLKLCWPLTCNPSVLQASDSLNDPIIWSTAAVPVETIDSQNCALVPVSGGMKYFRLKVP